MISDDSSRVEFELPMLEVGVRVPVIAFLLILAFDVEIVSIFVVRSTVFSLKRIQIRSKHHPPKLLHSHFPWICTLFITIPRDGTTGVSIPPGFRSSGTILGILSRLHVD